MDLNFFTLYYDKLKRIDRQKNHIPEDVLSLEELKVDKQTERETYYTKYGSCHALQKYLQFIA